MSLMGLQTDPGYSLPVDIPSENSAYISYSKMLHIRAQVKRMLKK